MPHKHTFIPSPTPHYDVCSICGTMHRVSDIAPPSVYADSYWNREGYSNIQEQIYNVSQFKNEAGETKIDAVLKHIGHDSHLHISVMEVACAPGSLLNALKGHYIHVCGVEYSDRYKAEILEESGLLEDDLIFGPFPSSTKHIPDETYDLYCALDFLEHLEDGQAVMDETKRLLVDGGTAVFMSPFLFDDGLYREQDRHPEHIWLYAQSYLKEWLGEMFSEVKFDRWITGHETLILKK